MCQAETRGAVLGNYNFLSLLQVHTTEADGEALEVGAQSIVQSRNG